MPVEVIAIIVTAVLGVSGIYISVANHRHFWPFTVNTQPSVQTLEVSNLNSRGVDANDRGRFREALNYFHQALEITRKAGDRVSEGATLNNIGGVYASQGQYDQALENHRQGLVIAREVGNRAGEGASLNNIGEVYRRLGQYA